MYLLNFFCSFSGRNKVGISSYYHFYRIRISPLIFPPEIIIISDSFLTPYKSLQKKIFICLRAGNKLVYPYLIAFTKFGFHPRFFNPQVFMPIYNPVPIILQAFANYSHPFPNWKWSPTTPMVQILYRFTSAQCAELAISKHKSSRQATTIKHSIRVAVGSMNVLASPWSQCLALDLELFSLMREKNTHVKDPINNLRYTLASYSVSFWH